MSSAVDAFLHQIHSATQKLKGMQEKVHQIMEEDIYGSLDTIQNFYLFDYEEAISRSWVCIKGQGHEFVLTFGVIAMY